ncbi:uncharacterized protein LOC131624182 [Vicia villosa]|uniref:uncharacterized protein LOC131624182 n=1 Tax=Vicia villosa TaxID=3911 RepID=UPI00273BED75|nr:uncharacterized protein LOC131624182 [Vicia villosa]
MVRKAIEVQELTAFNIEGRCDVSILQLFDDMLLIGNSDWQQVQALKEVLRGFKLISGLGVNFHKSHLIGINLNYHFVYAAANFLNCRVQSNSFDFLGFHLGVIHKLISWWESLLKKLKDRLGSWRGRILSLGGRISLIKSVLSSLAIFQLSFFKALSRIIKEIERIHSNFLWGNNASKRKIVWIKWEYLCLSKELGELGFKSFKEFNDSLLFKWK